MPLNLGGKAGVSIYAALSSWYLGVPLVSPAGAERVFDDPVVWRVPYDEDGVVRVLSAVFHYAVAHGESSEVYRRRDGSVRVHEEI